MHVWIHEIAVSHRRWILASTVLVQLQYKYMHFLYYTSYKYPLHGPNDACYEVMQWESLFFVWSEHQMYYNEITSYFRLEPLGRIESPGHLQVILVRNNFV